ncbi:hypothetical protein DL98DRAFT_501515 [Cadophora sp. DSE1049]|nr:hypothetical protein DL98DRAFT_501515 [Cadophora sp. DSE1049]
MSIHISTDMDQSEPSTSNSGSETMSPTATVFSSPPSTPVLRINHTIGDLSEDDVDKPVPGWPKLARTVADQPAFAAFPSFTDLNVKSLLYYQAQLIRLRKELHKMEFQDYLFGDNSEPKDPGKTGSGQEDVEHAESEQKVPEEKGREQLIILEKIRTILDKYNNALIQFSQISAFPEADSSNVECLRKCARKVFNQSAITGSGSQTWGILRNQNGTDEKQKSFWKLVWGLFVGFFKTPEVTRVEASKVFQEHLIVPRAESKPDGLTLWVTYSFIPLYHHVWKKCGSPTWASFWNSKCLLPRWAQESTSKPAAPKGSKRSKAGGSNLTSYSQSWILHVTSILTTIVACLLPIVAIVVLSRVHTMGMILGLIALFNSVFAFGLALISSTSSRVEIFTATAAFSAVMVVFVQNKISQN